jgi:hypothetical protein
VDPPVPWGTRNNLCESTYTLPAGLTPLTASGSGWVCAIHAQNATCTRADGLDPKTSYPSISLTASVSSVACPNVTNVAEVIHGGRAPASELTAVSGCLTVSEGNTPFKVSLKGSYTLKVSPVHGATIAGGITITDIVAAGLTPLSALADLPWKCGISAPTVTCTWPAQAMPPGGYPLITINLAVSASACPSVANQYAIQAAGGALDSFATSGVNVGGCLTLAPLKLDFGNGPLRTPGKMTVLVKTIEKVPMNVTAAISPVATPTAFSVTASDSCQKLGFGGTCTLTVSSLNPCLGPYAGTLTISADVDSAYQIPITAVGVANTASLELDGQVFTTGSNVNPNEQHTATLTLSPSPDPGCSSQPALVLGFLPKPPDPNWDVAFDLASNILYTGTVAGTIQLQAEIAGTGTNTVPIVASDGSGLFSLQVLPLPGTVLGVSIGNQTASSFEVAVSGFSTPRGTGDPKTAMTQVCLAVSAASGASAKDNAPPCVLAQDIEIWYERPASYAYGSKFLAGVIFSFSGDTRAIGQVKAWIRNGVGDGAPFCVDFRTGVQQACTN